jgi:hypothetical protein
VLTGVVLWEVKNIFKTLCLVLSEVCYILFQCGEPSEKYKESCRKCMVAKGLHLCSKCHKFGHPSNVCPDIWRKYHSVVSKLISVIFYFLPFLSQIYHILHNFT